MRKFILVFIVLSLFMPTTSAVACFCVGIGKDASPTGYAMVIHNEDDSATDVVMHYWVPARDDWLTNADPSDDVLPAVASQAQNIPQVAATKGFYYGEVKSAFGAGANSACGMLNEHGVSIMSNQCSSNVTTALATVVNGGIWYNLRRAVSERATSSRHAVEIVTQLLNDWGYSDSGRTYTIGDYREVWLVHVSRGQQYVATRVPDDHVAVMPNHYTIDHPDEYAPFGPYGLANSDVLYRSDLLTYTRTNFASRFPPASADADFNFRSIFRSGALGTGNTRRQAIAEYQYFGTPLSDDMVAATWHAARPFKFSQRITGKATIEQIFMTHTSHYEGTAWDTGRPFSGNPHNAGQRVCATATIESKIIQFHENLALTTMWTAFGHPCTLPYIPLHPLAYGANIENMVPDAVQFTAAEAAYRLANHTVNLRDHKLFRNNKQDKIRSFQYMMDMVYSQHYNSVFDLNKNYLFDMFAANNALIAGNPTVEALAAFDRNASDKALEMQEDYKDSEPLFGIPVYSTADYIDRTDTLQTQVDIVFELPIGKTPSATNLRFTLGSVTAPNAANITSGSLQALGGGKWKFTIPKATLTGSSGVGAGGNPGLYQFVLGGQTTSAPAEFFAGMTVLNITDGPVDYGIIGTTLPPFESVVLDTSYTSPEAQTVALTNFGTSFVMLNQPTALYFDVEKLAKTVIEPGQTISIDISPKPGLPAGNYSEAIVITGTNVSMIVDANFSVVPAEYIIGASQLDIVFPAAQAPSYTPPAAQIVTITNNGTGAVTLNQPTATDFDIGTLSTTNLAVGGTATFTVRPKAGLSADTYVETIDITGSGGASSAVVAFFVVAPEDYILSVAPIVFDFSTLQEPYTQPAAQTATISNNGTGAITLTQPTSTNFDIGALSTINLAAGGTATFTVRPKAGLAPATYVERINITGSGGTSSFVVATFTVTPAIVPPQPPETFAISVSEYALDFGAAIASYEPQNGQVVTVYNDGTGAVTLTQPTATNFDIGALSTANLSAVGDTATFTIVPKDGLAAGDYLDVILVTGRNGAGSMFSEIVRARFKVSEDLTVSGGGGGGSGCSVGLGLLALAMAAPFVVRKRK